MTEPHESAPVSAPRRPFGVPWPVALAAVVVGLVVGVGGPLVLLEVFDDDSPVPATFAPAQVTRSAGTLLTPTPAPRAVGSYEGYGAWVDVFDFSPPYAGTSPPVGPATIASMAEAGVRTIYLQAARLDDRSPDGIEDPWLLAEFLATAHAADIDVVGWYLPKFGDDGADLERLRLLADFEVLGHRFDGVAVDIEARPDDIDLDTRNQRLVELSAALRAELGTTPLGAIVLPPVLIEVVNEDFWPEFPWRELAGLYDVWLPMSYWSGRTESSGYRDGYTYNEESVRRLRTNIDDADALVHSIGGIGGTDGVDDPVDPPEPLATITQIEAFARSLTDTGSIGGSIYDWNTLEATIHTDVGTAVTDALATDPAAIEG